MQFPAATSRLLLRRLFPATRPAGRTRRRLLLPSSGLRFCLWVLLVWWRLLGRLLGRLMGRFLLRKARCVAAASEPSPKTILPSLHGGCSRLLCPSVRLPTCPSVRLSTCPSVDLSICPPAHLSVCPPAHLSVCPLVLHLFVYLSVHPYVCPPAHLSVCAPICLLICPCVLSVCASVHLMSVHLFT